MKNSFLVFLALVLLMGIAEVVGRAITWQADINVDVGTPRQGLTQKAIGDWVPNQNGVWIDERAHPYLSVINEAGFRNIEEVDPSAIHILALGDSYTFGLTVSNYEAWPHIAEKLIRRDTAYNLQILNNGIPGATIVDYLAYLKEKGKRLAPDYVLLVVHTNDVADLRKEGTHIGFLRAFGIGSHDNVAFQDVRWWLRHHSGLYKVARSIKEAFLVDQFAEEREQADIPVGNINTNPNGSSSSNPITAEEWNRYKSLLMEAITLCRTLGAEPVLTFLPAPGNTDTRVVDLIRAVGERTNTPLIDLSSSYEGYDPEFLTWTRDRTLDPAYEGDGHLTRMGNILVARRFATEFATILRASKTAP